MAKEQITNVDPLALTSLVSGSGNLSPQLQKLLENYLLRATQNLETSQIREEHEREVLEKQLKQKALSAARMAEISEQARLKDVERESRCGHAIKNPLGVIVPLVGGQRTGPGSWTFRCQACGKQWTDKLTMPPHLVPRQDKIGGMLL